MDIYFPSSYAIYFKEEQRDLPLPEDASKGHKKPIASLALARYTFGNIPILISYAEDELALILPLSHPFSSRKFIQKEDLYHLSFIALNTQSTIRNVIENTLIQHGIDSSYFKVEMELNSIEAIKNAVNSGLGAAFVSVSAITKELELGMFHWVKIDGITIKRTLSVLLNSKRYYSNATQIFKEEILGMLVTSSSKNTNLL